MTNRQRTIGGGVIGLGLLGVGLLTGRLTAPATSTEGPRAAAVSLPACCTVPLTEIAYHVTGPGCYVRPDHWCNWDGDYDVDLADYAVAQRRAGVSQVACVIAEEAQ